LRKGAKHGVFKVSCIERRINELFANELGVISDTLLTFTKKQLHYFGHAKWHNIRDQTSNEG